MDLTKHIFLILPLFTFLKADFIIQSTNGNTDQIADAAQCVLKLSAKYFVEKKAMSGSIVIININSYVSSTQGLLLETIHSGMKYSVMVKDSFYKHANASHFPEKAKNYMLILEDKTELARNINQLNKLPTWNPLAKAVVFYELKANDTSEDTSIEFINELRLHKLFKSIIFIYSPNSADVVAYTWKPYDKHNCGGMCKSVYILDICKDGMLTQISAQHEMFPADLQGCPLVTYAVISEPYVMPPVKKLTNTSFNDYYEFQHGGEINLIKIISEFTNTSLIMRMSETPENWGAILPNGTATGAMELLRNDSVDVVIGNIEVTRTVRKWLDPTVSYTQDEMTWCVPKAKQASTWNNLVIIFQWTTWVATFVSLVAMGLVFHLFYYKENEGKVTRWPTNSLLMAFSMLLGWGANFEPKTLTFRILLVGWLLFSINMGISYESFLRSFLMHPRFEKQISSDADLIESGISIGGRGVYRNNFKNNNASSFYLYEKYNTTTYFDGIRAVAAGKFAVVSARRQANYMDQKLGKGKPLIFCFPESNNIYKYGVVLLTRKWFPFLERFNSIIRSVTENGLIEKWNEESMVNPAKGEGTSVIDPLAIRHLLGAFMFIALMYAASILVFLIELLCGYLDKKAGRVFS